MRLRQIRLAGFKSFVDPTTIDIPGNLVGVVGPNGCGKSNVIDAVRWVMGEISAKHLRGESMADVVFSGSGSRKPLGQASVELVFDNADGGLGGRYASYAELSVKRLVTRDAAQSHYYLNGTRCRRRDVTDVFLGTGLGSRSYSIIEQGMISRLIEAKPDELREFLEEAAGISKYKERRRETENRISRAEENLDRLSDLRDELEQRLQHLKRQAAMAEKYKVLKLEERVLRAQLLSLKWRALDQTVHTEAGQTRTQQTVLESAIASQRRLENSIEKRRTEHSGETEAFNEVYREVLDVGVEIARIEESIQHLKSRRTDLREGLEREETHRDEAQRHLALEQRELDQLNQMLAKEQPELERLKQIEAGSKAEFGRFEEAMQSLQAAWDDLNQRAAHPTEIVHAERARSQQLEERIEQILNRIARLEEESTGLKPEELGSEVAERQARLVEEQAVLSEVESSLHAQQDAIDKIRRAASDSAERLNGAREWYQETRGRLASLQLLQQETLGKISQSASAWLAEHHLSGSPRLAEQMDVEPGWERAVETVLGPHLEAICVAGAEHLYRQLSTLEEGSVEVFDTTALERVARASEPRGTLLSEKIRSPGSLDGALSDVYALDSLDEALAGRAGLENAESLITRDGLWLGKNWARVARGAPEGAGGLSREQEMKQLGAEVERAQSEVERWLGLSREQAMRLTELEDQSTSLRRTFADEHHRIAASQSDLSARQTGLDQSRERAAAIEEEITELKEQERRGHHQLNASRERLELSRGEAIKLTGERDEYAARRQTRRTELEAARERWQAIRDDVYEVGVRAESMRTKLASLHAGMARDREQTEKIERRCAELRAALEATKKPLDEAREQLARLLDRKRTSETSLDGARQRVESAEAALRESEQQRGSVEKKVEVERTKLEELRMQARETMVRRSTMEEQLGDGEHDLEQVLSELPEDASEDKWGEELARMERRITRLGPINLAAIDEFNQESERKAYLDSQHEDLVQALDTLRQAIRKIDRETRSRFKDTYEKVNAGLAETFPRLFGGGTAFLQMTGDDLLSTGISVVARPPGKRNTSIHLLSGGEKALAAIALVFSIFNLNPAPFCLLDEVDAPLDDANVGRFCELVKSMTERVQFVVVTHNKATMEVTQQLIGVTMSEPGISRLVAVDIEDAAELAAV